MLLKSSLYGLKQASLNWYEKLREGLLSRGFKSSVIDPCLYIKDGMLLLTYVDDCIIASPSMDRIDHFVHSMKTGPENFVLTDEGDVDKFLGIEITKHEGSSFELSQPYLIERILRLLGLLDNDFKVDTNPAMTPAFQSLLHRDLAGKPRRRPWNYRTAIGMLNYLQGHSRPDISMAVHQCARYSTNPMLSHEKAVMRIGRYLLHTKTRGMIFEPDISKGLEVYVDADFAGGWDKADADNAENVLSRTGYAICYANCPILAVSKLQTEIALSTAEAEYIALSQSLREAIPLMTLLEEIHEHFPVVIGPPNFICTVHEDNQSCIRMAQSDKFTPRTKHIALKYHHFRSFLKSDPPRIAIKYCRTDVQKADILTKPLKDDVFIRLRMLLLGW